ncbi:MAG: SIS domain-containing protein [Phycisphaerales bacterium]|nr:SIS domain-containing protein [Phycisphaerales bacterium]
MPSQIRESINKHLASLQRIADASGTIEHIAKTIEQALASGKKILTCGNGGSAAEALHFAEEMMGRFSRDRAPMAAVCLSADPAAMTCISNDYGFEEVFARQVQGLGKKGDVLVALSTSGKSPNILKALRRGRETGLVTVGLLGRPGSPAESDCDIAFTSDAGHSAHIQELHLLIIHLVLEYLDGPASEPA